MSVLSFSVMMGAAVKTMVCGVGAGGDGLSAGMALIEGRIPGGGEGFGASGDTTGGGFSGSGDSDGRGG